VKTRLWLWLFLPAVAAPATALAWGRDVHRLINRSAVDCLPAEFGRFGQWTDDLERLSTAPDERRPYTEGEGIRHYIDIDDYPEFFAGTLPHDYQAMVARYGASRVEENGIAPWAIEETYLDLADAFRARDWDRAVALAADIGHYVGDLHNPLHCTLNYDGQLSGQDGIHSRFESEMTRRYLESLTPSARTASALPDVLESVFDGIDQVYPGVQIILAGDRTARAQAGGHVNGDAYYDALWMELGQYADHWIDEACVAVASIWTTAWVEAGSPPLPGASPIQATTFGRLKARWNAPVPR
jgi:hypothetical protein